MINDPPIDPTAHLGGPEELEAHRDRAEPAPLTEAELDVMERDIKRWGPDRPHSVPLDANETNVLRLVAEVRRLRTSAPPEQIRDEIAMISAVVRHEVGLALETGASPPIRKPLQKLISPAIKRGVELAYRGHLEERVGPKP